MSNISGIKKVSELLVSTNNKNNVIIMKKYFKK